jgi:DNA repair exonuclease SbcCD nuclease subunit
VETIAGVATQHKVDAILVAGDVFDAQTIALRTVRKVFNAMQAYAGPWILIAGNHDAALTESIWTQARRLNVVPGNVHLALEGGTLPFEALNFVALCAPLTQRHTYNDLTEPFDQMQTPPGMLRIGLAHGSVQGILAEGIDSTNPIEPQRAGKARLDYLALGDWHGCKQIDDRTWYSGTPEQDRFKGNEPGYALLVRIERSGDLPQVTRVQTGKYVWREWQQTLSVPSDVDELIVRLQTLTPGDIVSLRLSGQTDMAGQQRIQSALDAAHAIARSVTSDLTALRLIPTDEDIAAMQADGYLGEVIAQLRELQGSGQEPEKQDTATQALAILAMLLTERQAQGGAA